MAEMPEIQRRSFKTLFEKIEHVDAKGMLGNLPPELVAACIVKESYGNAFFECRCGQYTQNMNFLRSQCKHSEAELAQWFKVKRGPNAGKVSKFRFEKVWFSTSKALAQNTESPEKYSILWSCSYGLGQKAMCYHLAAKPEAVRLQEFEKFIGDEFEQIRVCANDLRILIQKAHGDLPLALSKYNAGAAINRVTEYGKRVYSLYEGFLRQAHGG
jgi:hypothetical protein